MILGAGPAGLAAAIYACRAKIPTLVLDKLSPGGQVLLSDRVENYPGFPDGISGVELTDRLVAQARRFGMEQESGEVVSLQVTDPGRIDGIKLVLDSGKEILTTSLIIATGASHENLNVPGEKELAGKGVSYCATCDGPFFKDSTVAVIGGGDSAVEEAIFLTKFAKKVFLVHRRDQLRATRFLQEQALANPKIEPVWDTIVEAIHGKDKVEYLSLLNNKTGERSKLPLDGVFIFIGTHPNTSFLRGLVKMDDRGFILTDNWMRTSVPGIFAAGDCRSKPLLQIVTAVAEGATAAYAVEQEEFNEQT